MQLKVSPTRMELLRLRRRIELARRGHKLLQDKLEGLVREFMPLVSEYVRLRGEFDSRFPRLSVRFGTIAAELGAGPLGTALAGSGLSAQVELSEERRANVPVPVLRAGVGRARGFYSLAATPQELDAALGELAEIFPLAVRVAESEETLRRLAAEVERTRRRVNALEYVMIPRLLEARKLIQAKLDEDERAARIRSMKVKEILERAGRRA